MPVLKWNAFLSLFVEIFRDRPVPHEHPDHEKCGQQGVFDESRLDLAFLMSTFKNGWFLNFRNFATFSFAKASPTWNSTRMWGSWWSGPTFLGLFAQVKSGNLKIPAEYLNFDFSRSRSERATSNACGRSAEIRRFPEKCVFGCKCIYAYLLTTSPPFKGPRKWIIWLAMSHRRK